MRTRKAAAKRFKLTKTGKLMHRGHGAKHLMSNKSKRQIRALKQVRAVTGKYRIKIKQMLGVA